MYQAWDSPSILALKVEVFHQFWISLPLCVQVFCHPASDRPVISLFLGLIYMYVKPVEIIPEVSQALVMLYDLLFSVLQIGEFLLSCVQAH